MQRECKIAIKSEEFVRRGLHQVKGSGPSETFRRRQGAVPERRLEGVRELSRGVKVLLKVLKTLGKM
ncbi:UNVERIFIED_CONTAM: hypothetical protein Sradi_2083200 [Sesamum radiatum]|uniref:Uncharacterized protein n=1 Tax=Sesamum radiatum TaxID=300843 RepID=A0AAW2TIL0_SESRA